MWRPERVIVIEVCDGVVGGAMAGVAAACGLELFPRLVPLWMWGWLDPVG
jgi:hypothetical protein